MFFGNGCVIGGSLWFDTKATVTDGLGRIVIYKQVRTIRMLKTILGLTRKEIGAPELIRYEGYVPKIVIKKRDNTALRIDFDGELQEPQKVWVAEIVKEGLPFVIPKEVSL